MTKDQKASIYATAIQHYLFAGDFRIEEADLTEMLYSDSVEDVQEAYRLIDHPEFQRRVKQTVTMLLEATTQISESLASSGEEEEVNIDIRQAPEQEGGTHDWTIEDMGDIGKKNYDKLTGNGSYS